MDEKITISVEEFARRLGISRPTAYAMTNEPGFPVLRIGRKKLVVVSGIESWMQRRMQRQEG